MEVVVKLVDVYHDSWRSKSIDEVYLETMKKLKMEGIIDFIVFDEYNGYSIQFYEFSKLAAIFKEIFPSKMKKHIQDFVTACYILMRTNNDVQDDGKLSNSKDHKDELLNLLKEYEYSDDDIKLVELLFKKYYVEWDVENVTIDKLNLKFERYVNELEDDDDE